MDKAYQKLVRFGETYLETYIEAKSNLNKVYQGLMREDLERKNEEIERCHNKNQAAQSWSLIRDISGKGSPQLCQIKGSAAEDKLRAWHSL